MKKGFILAILLLMAGCAPAIPQNIMLLAPESLAQRQMQTRRFATTNYEAMLNAAAAVFQDLGFALEESEVELGVVVGSKKRDATSGGQIAGAVLLALLTGTPTSVDKDQIIRASMVMRQLKPAEHGEITMVKLAPEIMDSLKNDMQQAAAAVFNRHFPENVGADMAERVAAFTEKALREDLTRLLSQQPSGESTVRVTFQRIIYNTQGQVTLTEQINDPLVYQEFFDKLSQAVFLEAHEL